MPLYKVFFGFVCFQVGKYNFMKIQEKNNPYERPVLVIKSQVKKWFKERKMRVSDLTARAVNDSVILLLERAIIRAKLNKRRTIFEKDI